MGILFSFYFQYIFNFQFSQIFYSLPFSSSHQHHQTYCLIVYIYMCFNVSLTAKCLIKRLIQRLVTVRQEHVHKPHLPKKKMKERKKEHKRKNNRKDKRKESKWVYERESVRHNESERKERERAETQVIFIFIFILFLHPWRCSLSQSCWEPWAPVGHVAIRRPPWTCMYICLQVAPTKCWMYHHWETINKCDFNKKKNNEAHFFLVLAQTNKRTNKQTKKTKPKIIAIIITK